MERARLIAGVTLVLVIAAALIFVIVRNADEVDEPTTAGTSAPAEDEDPTPEPTPEGDEEPVAVPTPDTTGRDFDHIFREIVAFRDWLFANPDPNLLSLIYHPDCDCYESTESTLAALQNRDARITGDGTSVQDLEVLEEFESLVRVQVRLETPEQVLRDEHDDEVETSPPQADAYEIVLVRPGTRWTIRTIEVTP